MHILGISAFYHDSAATMVWDGEVIAAAEEERFTRKKHTYDFPINAIGYCLKEANISASEVDHIVFYEKPFQKFDRILENALSMWPLSYKGFLKSIPVWMREKLDMGRFIRKALDLPADKRILFLEHHISHAASAFLPSPFQRAAILTLDGVGEWCTSAYGFGEENQIRIEKEIGFPHSLGLLYSAITAYLGFRVNDAEWKVMGLAPYGRPTFLEHFRKLADVKEDGSFRLNMKYFSHHYSTVSPFSREFEDLFGRPARRSDEEIDDFHKDIAHSGQRFVEEIIIKIALSLHKRYECDHLVIGGGVGLNSCANWRIIQKTPFRDIFIQPAAGDDGASLGAALYVYNSLLGHSRRYIMKNAYLGPSYTDEEVKRTLDEQRAKYVTYEDMNRLIEDVARMVFEKKVVGWFQGRMEFGPRALGNRSILANPCFEEMKALINQKVKYREWFRPFAPAVLKEEAGKFFDLQIDSPFMLLIPDVRPEFRDRLQAVTHVDGTGRVQTVERNENPLFHKLIRKFQDYSGVPVVLNTSFNIRGEPIVCTPFDAYSCFMRTGIDVLVMGRYLLTEKNDADVARFVELNKAFISHDEDRDSQLRVD